MDWGIKETGSGERMCPSLSVMSLKFWICSFSGRQSLWRSLTASEMSCRWAGRKLTTPSSERTMSTTTAVSRHSGTLNTCFTWTRQVWTVLLDWPSERTQLEDPRAQWQREQEAMLRDYLAVARDALSAQKEIYQVKEQRLQLAQQEYRQLNDAWRDKSTSQTSRESESNISLASGVSCEEEERWKKNQTVWFSVGLKQLIVVNCD